VERDGEIIQDFAPGFTLADDDEIYVCGSIDALNRFYESLPRDQAPAPPLANPA